MLIARPHQTEAIEATVAGLRASRRGQLIMACGTGKTLVAQRVAEELGAQKILVLAPTLGLLDQLARAWADNTAWDDWRAIAVCGRGELIGVDPVRLEDAEVGCRIERLPGRIAAFVKSAGQRVVFATYASADLITARFDLGIFDEAHRTAGVEGKAWSGVLDESQFSIDRRLSCTATPRVLRGRRGFVSVSMDDEAIYGPKLHSLSYADAVAANIVKRIRLGVAEIRTEDAGSETHAAVAVAIERMFDATNTKKMITFHSTVDAAAEYARRLPMGFHINGKMPAKSRRQTLRSFQDGLCGVLTNARCLSEGVDAPAVESVGFIDPKDSVIDIMQAIGRASRRSPGTDPVDCYVFLPLFVRPNECVDDAAERGAFESTISVIRTLMTHDAVSFGGLLADRRAVTPASIFAWIDGDSERLQELISVGILDPLDYQRVPGARKAIMISMARAGRPKPRPHKSDPTERRLAVCFCAYTSPKSPEYDREFHAQMNSLGWLTPEDRQDQAKAQLLQLAQRGEAFPLRSLTEPSDRYRLATLHGQFRNKNNKRYDAAFDAALSALGWHITHRDELLYCAETGKSPSEAAFGQIRNLLNPRYKWYDADWAAKVLALRPEWALRERRDPTAVRTALLAAADRGDMISGLGRSLRSDLSALTKPSSRRFDPALLVTLIQRRPGWIVEIDRKQERRQYLAQLPETKMLETVAHWPDAQMAKEATVLRFLETHDEIRTRDAQRLLQTNSGFAARRVLDRLVAKGLLVREGMTQNTRFIKTGGEREAASHGSGNSRSSA